MPTNYPSLHLHATERLAEIARREIAAGRGGLTFSQGNRDLLGPLPDFSVENRQVPHWVPFFLRRRRAEEQQLLREQGEEHGAPSNNDHHASRTTAPIYIYDDSDSDRARRDDRDEV